MSLTWQQEHPAPLSCLPSSPGRSRGAQDSRFPPLCPEDSLGDVSGVEPESSSPCCGQGAAWGTLASAPFGTGLGVRLVLSPALQPGQLPVLKAEASREQSLPLQPPGLVGEVGGRADTLISSMGCPLFLLTAGGAELGQGKGWEHHEPAPGFTRAV